MSWTVTASIVTALLALLGLAVGFAQWRRQGERLRRSHRAARVQTERHRQALQASEARFQGAFDHAAIGMAVVDAEGRVSQANRALIDLLGSDPAGRSLDSVLADDDSHALSQALGQLARQEIGAVALELRFVDPRGRERWLALQAAPFVDMAPELAPEAASSAGRKKKSKRKSDQEARPTRLDTSLDTTLDTRMDTQLDTRLDLPEGAATCLIAQVQDISERREAESRLQQIAFNDSLTGLPNRGRFVAQLQASIQRSKRSPGARGFAMLFLDFDRFKLINDSMGHAAGDAFLVHVGRRIRAAARPQDIVARLGGDEFAVLIESHEPLRIAHWLAERLLLVLREPLAIEGVMLAASASIGITEGSIGYEHADEVMRDADIAMYKAKSAGKARWALFDVAMREQWRDRLRLEADLRKALAEGALQVYYQPLFNLAEAELTGFEALARWDHPVHGVIGPTTFIPMAEEAGLICDLTEFVMREACHQLGVWQRREPAFSQLQMHVNVAGPDLARADFASRVTRALQQARLRPEHLVIELTENILMERVDGAFEMLEGLTRLGVGLSVDDFGTGYSSLSYLSRLPIDSLKIDASFVRGLGPGSRQTEVVRAIVSLGTALGKAVIAEGIESDDQLEALRLLGCEHGQGFHMALPLPAPGVEALLDAMSIAPHYQPSSVMGLASFNPSGLRH